MNRWGALALAALTLLTRAAWVNAATSVPATLNHQGRLLTAQMAPVSGQHTLTFRLYDASSGGTLVWMESQLLTFDDGYYATSLGAIVPFGVNVFNGGSRYLAIAVDDDAEMTPREPILSVPYALTANQANHATEADHATNATNVTGTLSASMFRVSNNCTTQGSVTDCQCDTSEIAVSGGAYAGPGRALVESANLLIAENVRDIRIWRVDCNPVQCVNSYALCLKVSR